MADRRTLFGVRIGPDPAEVRAIHRARQSNLPEQARASDPSALERVVERTRGRDELVRGRHEWRLGGGND